MKTLNISLSVVQYMISSGDSENLEKSLYTRDKNQKQKSILNICNLLSDIALQTVVILCFTVIQ